METRSRKQEFKGKYPINPYEDEREELMTEDDSEDDDHTNVPRIPQKKIFKIPSQKKKLDNQRPYDTNVIYAVLFVILAIVIAYFFLHPELLPEFSNLHSRFDTDYDCGNNEFVLDQFENMKKKFSSQDDDTWITFASGLQRLFTSDPTEPAGFLLFHDSDDVTVKCLVKDVSEIAARCFKKATVFSINGESLKADKYIKDSGEFIERYKSEIVDKKVMIMYNLNDVPTNVAKVLHYIFDVYNPLVRESVNFVTLKKQLTNVTLTNNKHINVVSNELKNLWKELEYNELDPLITRITTQLVVISKEKDLSC